MYLRNIKCERECLHIGPAYMGLLDSPAPSGKYHIRYSMEYS